MTDAALPYPKMDKKIEESVRVAVFLLVLTSAVALLITQKLTASALLLIGVTVMAWISGNKTRISPLIWEIASFCYLIFFFFDLFRISASLAPALVHLFIFIIVNKIFNLRSDRDYYQLYLLTFLTVLAASSLSIEIEMLYLIVLYIMLLLWNMTSMTLIREWRKDDSSDNFPFSIFSPVYAIGVFVTGLATFALALGIFFLLPRVQLGYFAQLSAGKVQHVSGFSESVNLGEIAAVERDPTIAMRVRVTSRFPIQQRLYWRGIAFDHYDGKAWSSTIPGNRFLFEDSDNFYYNYRYTENPDYLVKQEIYLAPLDTRVIFGADRVIRIYGRFGAITRNHNGTLIGMSQAESYEVYSRLTQTPVRQLRNAKNVIPDNIKRYYTQLPFRSNQMEELVQSITADADSTYDRVIAVQKYLENNFAYSTANLPEDDFDPISEFLFDTKSGHCEYFASSMAILLRYVGIPSRVVNGFLEGEYNKIGNFYAVRQSDAHSWVEVYFDGAWFHFDPSPRLIGAASGDAVAWWRRVSFRQIVDSIEFFWDRYILIYSAEDQMNAITSVREKYQQLSDRMRREPGDSFSFASDFEEWWSRNGFKFGLAILLIAVLAVAIRMYFIKRRNAELCRTPVLFYQQMLSILRQKGLMRRPQVTPAEFVQEVGAQVSPAYRDCVSSLTDLFYKARYGNYLLSDAEQSSVRDSLRRLEQMQ